MPRAWAAARAFGDCDRDLDRFRPGGSGVGEPRAERLALEELHHRIEAASFASDVEKR